MVSDVDAVDDGTGVRVTGVRRVLAREQAVGRLMLLDARGELATAHVRLVASAVGVSARTVWRWVALARSRGRTRARERARFTITPDLHARLVRWCGNAAAVHRELLAEAAAPGDGSSGRLPPAPPSLATLHRAIRTDLDAGQRAALRGGERARRAHDVHLRRPREWRNACWEGDHKHAPVEVDLDGELVTPWITWFVDCATGGVCGVAVTPHTPSRDAILAALRIALSRTGPYGPIGGVPAQVRIDRGRDFLSRTVTTALGAFAVPVHALPAYSPHLKGTVENLNKAVETMFLASLPRYTKAPTATVRRRDPHKDPTPALPFTAFVELLLDWVHRWNTEHPSSTRGGRTPLQAWKADPTPIDDADPALLWAFTLEDDTDRVRRITTQGVRWRHRHYIGPWMTGRTGTPVRVRFVPHHDHEIEVFHASTERHLGTAHLADAATEEQRAALRRTRAAHKRRLQKALAASADQRDRRYAAVTTAVTPERLGAVTATEAGRELTHADHTDLAALALPDLIPPSPPPADWRTPTGARTDTRTPDPTVLLPPARAIGPAAPADTDSPRRHP